MTAERRITHQLVDYWQRIKAGKMLPSEMDIDPDHIPEMWHDCFLIQIRDREDLTRDRAYSYSYVGDALSSVFVSDKNGEGALVSLTAEKLSAYYTEMRMTKLPIVEDVEDAEFNGRPLKYRQCLLPVGDSTGEVLGIFGGMRYKLD